MQKSEYDRSSSINNPRYLIFIVKKINLRMMPQLSFLVWTKNYKVLIFNSERELLPNRFDF